MLCELQQYNLESQCEILSTFRYVEPASGLLKKKQKQKNNKQQKNPRSQQFFEMRKCVRGRKVPISNVFYYNYCARCH